MRRRTWHSGPGAARALPVNDTAAAAAVFVQLALRCGRNWAAQWHLARAVGKRFQGHRAKRADYSGGPPRAVGCAEWVTPLLGSDDDIDDALHAMHGQILINVRVCMLFKLE